MRSRWPGPERRHSSCQCRAGSRIRAIRRRVFTHHPNRRGYTTNFRATSLAEPPIFHHRCLQARGNTITFAQNLGEAGHRLFLYRFDTGTLTEITSGFSPELVAPEMVLSPEAVLFMVRDPDFDLSKGLGMVEYSLSL